VGPIRASLAACLFASCIKQHQLQRLLYGWPAVDPCSTVKEREGSFLDLCTETNFLPHPSSRGEAWKMPSATIDSHGVSGVAAAAAFLDTLLERAESVKRTASIEPPLEKSDFDDLRQQLSDALGYELPPDESADSKRTQRFAVIETAVRDTFESLIVSRRSVRE
jgi:hypothetical protein